MDVSAKDEVEALRHTRCKNMSKINIFKALNKPNSSSFYLKYILHLTDILYVYIPQDIFYMNVSQK